MFSFLPVLMVCMNKPPSSAPISIYEEFDYGEDLQCFEEGELEDCKTQYLIKEKTLKHLKMKLNDVCFRWGEIIGIEVSGSKSSLLQLAWRMVVFVKKIKKVFLGWEGDEVAKKE